MNLRKRFPPAFFWSLALHLTLVGGLLYSFNRNGVIDSRPDPGAYSFLRRRFVNMCAQPMGVDVACVAAKVYGAVQRRTSFDYRARFEALKDRLMHFDELGLKGIRALVRGV